MKKILLAVLFIAFVFLITSNYMVKADSMKEKERYLVGFNSNIDYKLIDSLKGQIIREYENMSVVLVELNQKSAEKLSKEIEVLYVEPDEAISAASLPLLNTSTEDVQWGGNVIKADLAHQEGYKGEGVNAKIESTGIARIQ